MGADLSKEYSVSPPSYLHNIEIHLQWSDRGNINQLTQSYRNRSVTIEYYRWLCHRLKYEHGVYVPPVLPYHSNWKTLFFELFTLRNLWSGGSTVDGYNNDLGSSSSNERFKRSIFSSTLKLTLITLKD